jgi:RNA polymerase sigma-70 factor (ECF subfamily)
VQSARPSDGPSDEALLSEFLAGDARAFETLVRRYSPELFAFVVRFVGNRTLAEDVVQESFLQLYRSAPGFDPGRRFKPWLFTIAANKARDLLRSRSRRREVALEGLADSESGAAPQLLDLFADESDPGQALEVDEQRDVVRAVVAEMPDHLREVLVLGYYHRFPYAEIAEILDVPLGTVKSRLHAAVAFFARAYRKSVSEARPS